MPRSNQREPRSTQRRPRSNQRRSRSNQSEPQNDSKPGKLEMVTMDLREYSDFVTTIDPNITVGSLISRIKINDPNFPSSVKKSPITYAHYTTGTCPPNGPSSSSIKLNPRQQDGSPGEVRVLPPEEVLELARRYKSRKNRKRVSPLADSEETPMEQPTADSDANDNPLANSGETPMEQQITDSDALDNQLSDVQKEVESREDVVTSENAAPESPVVVEAENAAPESPVVVEAENAAPESPVVELEHTAPKSPVVEVEHTAPKSPVVEAKNAAPTSPVVEAETAAPKSPILEIAKEHQMTGMEEFGGHCAAHQKTEAPKSAKAIVAPKQDEKMDCDESISATPATVNNGSVSSSFSPIAPVQLPVLDYSQMMATEVHIIKNVFYSYSTTPKMRNHENITFSIKEFDEYFSGKIRRNIDFTEIEYENWATAYVTATMKNRMENCDYMGWGFQQTQPIGSQNSAFHKPTSAFHKPISNILFVKNDADQKLLYTLAAHLLPALISQAGMTDCVFWNYLKNAAPGMTDPFKLCNSALKLDFLNRRCVHLHALRNFPMDPFNSLLFNVHMEMALIQFKLDLDRVVLYHSHN